MFWRDDPTPDDPAQCDPADAEIEAVEGYSVDGCFTLPGEDPTGQPAEVPDAQSLGIEQPESS